MKRQIILLIILLLCKAAFSQNIKAGFVLNIDTLPSAPEKESFTRIKISVLKDKTSKLKNLKVSIKYMEEKSNLLPENIYFSQKYYSIKDLSDETKIDIPIKVVRDSTDDRIAYLKLMVIKDDGSSLSIDAQSDSIMQLYIKPYKGLKTNAEFEPLIFAGTNFDLLDGVQAKNLYVKFNFFWKLSTHNYLQFGLVKNRLFNQPDSIDNVGLFDGFRTKKNLTDTTISLVRGIYSKKVTYKNEPISLYMEYHRKIVEWSTSKTSFFVTGGLEVGLFKTTITNTMSNLVSDTTVVKLDSQRFVFQRFIPEHSYTRPNYLYYTGFMFMFDNDDINLKLQVLGGYNNYWYPLAISNQRDIFRKQVDPFFNIKINTVIKNPTIGLGIEVLTRRSTTPLFGITLSKVLDVKDIKTLFSPINSIK